jgi:hypothetical protein
MLEDGGLSEEAVQEFLRAYELDLRFTSAPRKLLELAAQNPAAAHDIVRRLRLTHSERLEIERLQKDLDWSGRSGTRKAQSAAGASGGREVNSDFSDAQSRGSSFSRLRRLKRLTHRLIPRAGANLLVSPQSSSVDLGLFHMRVEIRAPERRHSVNATAVRSIEKDTAALLIASRHNLPNVGLFLVVHVVHGRRAGTAKKLRDVSFLLD